MPDHGDGKQRLSRSRLSGSSATSSHRNSDAEIKPQGGSTAPSLRNQTAKKLMSRSVSASLITAVDPAGKRTGTTRSRPQKSVSSSLRRPNSSLRRSNSSHNSSQKESPSSRKNETWRAFKSEGTIPPHRSNNSSASRLPQQDGSSLTRDQKRRLKKKISSGQFRQNPDASGSGTGTGTTGPGTPGGGMDTSRRRKEQSERRERAKSRERRMAKSDSRLQTSSGTSNHTGTTSEETPPPPPSPLSRKATL